MTEKRLVRTQRDAGTPEPEVEREPSLARGSTAQVTAEHVKSISQPRISRAPLSAFQLPVSQRNSEPEIMIPQPVSTSERRYLIAIVALLLCVVAVLTFLLLV